MGKHQHSHASPWHRARNNRVAVVTTAVGAVLIAGGTAGAAVIGDTGMAPGSVANDASTPAAATSPPHEPQQQPVEEQRAATEQRDAATETAQLPFDTAAVSPEEDDSDTSGTPDNERGSPTGEGGNCEASNYSEAQPTANGETFDPGAMTAAHKELPFDTMVEVTNPANGSSVTVRINDRGPFIKGRCLDLSSASFEKIASSSQGVVNVEWQVVE